MPLQQPRPRKGLSTHGALARQSVGPDVHLQRAQRHVHFFAVLAAELLPRPLPGGAVELLMLGKTRVRRVTFSAVWTLVPRPLAPLFGQIFGIPRRRRRRCRGTRAERRLIHRGIQHGPQRQRLLYVRYVRRR